MAIKMTVGGETQPQPNLPKVAQAQIGAERSQLLADMLNKMSIGADRLPGSDLEGASRVLNAGLGAYHGYQRQQQELAHRNALIEALGGDVSPFEAALVASGDKSGINSIVQARAAEAATQRQIDRKAALDRAESEREIQKMVAAGVPENIARAQKAGAIKINPDGSVVDLRTGTVSTANGTFRANGLQGAQQGAPAPTGGSAAPGFKPALGGAPAAPGGAPAADPAAAGQGQLTTDRLMPSKETTNEAQKQMSSLNKQDDALTVVEKLTKDEYLTAQGQAGNWLESIFNWFGEETGTSDTVGYSMWRGAVDRAFNEYRKYVTGAAAAVSELERLEKAFISPGQTLQQFAGQMAVLRATGRRNYAINSMLVAQGIPQFITDPQTGQQAPNPQYGAAFEAAMADPNFAFNADEVRADADRIVKDSRSRGEAPAAAATPAAPAAQPQPRGAPNAAPAAQAAPAGTKVINGKTYKKVNGQWFEE